MIVRADDAGIAHAAEILRAGGVVAKAADFHVIVACRRRLVFEQ